MDPIPTSIWDTLAALLWPFRGPVLCQGCQVALKGPAVHYSGNGMTRKHFGDRCITCYLRHTASEDRALWEKWTQQTRAWRLVETREKGSATTYIYERLEGPA